MTLGRQLAYAISIIFFIALGGVQAIHLRSAQAHLQRQLESLAQDAATSLGLSLGALLRTGDAALAETVINPAFDRGHYERIEYLSPGGEPLVTKRLALEQGDYPAWFARMFGLSSPTAESLVSAGWRQLGKVRVTVHPRYAYEQLWQTARDTVLYLVLIYAAALLALRLFLRGLLRPLVAVENAALAISARDFVTLRLRPSTRELARVVEAMNTMSEKMREAMETESRRASQMQAAAYRDDVTGLLNARGFVDRFESVYEAEAGSFRGTLAMAEIADLGGINRQIGPERCDDLLRTAYRPMDDAATAVGGFAGRWTGALTVVVLPGVTGEAARAQVAALRERAAAALRELGVENGRVHCAGVEATGPAPLNALVRAVEEALLRAREAQGGVLVMSAAQAAPGAAAESEVDVVRAALQARRLQLVGQEAFRMSDHRGMHVEIYARLRDAAGREMAAAQFMPVVAAHDLAEELDRAVIERVIEAARSGVDDISINVSVRSAQRPSFLGWLQRMLSESRGVAARLAFELPEHGVVANEPAAMAFARTVRGCGARFGIDHFGVHKDSLALMQRLRPDYLKLAGSHTVALVKDQSARFFAESVVRAARQLDVPVIAQNVEDDEMYQSIADIGFTGYQGNLGGRPSPWPPS
jgi:EAL domain-containing protein (putative c-di-GMP-specific phosphodiesterase class I)/GGDEF domain-containing protein